MDGGDKLKEFKTEQDLKTLLDNKIPESINLEYKEIITENKEIAKDISAFANTKGGVIIYGIKEKELIPKELTPFPISGIPEKIENVLWNGISPKLECEIFPISSMRSKTKGYIVVKIPESPYKPHMVNYNHKYYKRQNFSNVPMEEYEIERCYEQRKKSIERIRKLLTQEQKTIESEFIKYISSQGLISFLSIPLVYKEERIKIFVYDFDSFIKNISIKYDLLPPYMEISIINGEIKKFGILSDYNRRSSPPYEIRHPLLCIGKKGIIRYSIPISKGKIIPYKMIVRKFDNYLTLAHKIFEREEYRGYFLFQMRLDYARGVKIINFYNILENKSIEEFMKVNSMQYPQLSFPDRELNKDNIIIERKFLTGQMDNPKIILDVIKELHRKWGYNVLD